MPMTVMSSDQAVVWVTTLNGQVLLGRWRMIMPPEGQTRTNAIIARRPDQVPDDAPLVLSEALRARDK